MKTIYFTDAQGKKVYVEVSDEVAAAYRDCQREEWRSDAYESYHAISLDRLAETGYEVADRSATIEQRHIERAEHLQRRRLLTKLKRVLPQLTELQRASFAFWSNHDIDQMLRIFATSGLYRADKPQSYYEHTAIKAVKGTPVYNPPKASNAGNNKPSGNGSGSGKGGK